MTKIKYISTSYYYCSFDSVKGLVKSAGGHLNFGEVVVYNEVLLYFYYYYYYYISNAMNLIIILFKQAAACPVRIVFYKVQKKLTPPPQKRIGDSSWFVIFFCKSHVAHL